MVKIGVGAGRVCHDWRSLLRSFERHVRPDSVVLEIGASNPERTRDLSRLCRRVVGVEVDPDRVPEDFDNVTYMVGDWQRLSEAVEVESIDIAVASHVIEHVPDDLGAVNELYAVLKPGGIGLLNTPNRKRLTRAVIESFTGERKFPHWEHQREYVEEDLLSLLRRSRFDRYSVEPVALGILGGPVYVYTERVPAGMRRHASFWEVHVLK